MEKATIETKKRLLFPVAMGDEVIAIISSCVRGNFVYEEIWNPGPKDELNCQ